MREIREGIIYRFGLLWSTIECCKVRIVRGPGSAKLSTRKSEAPMSLLCKQVAANCSAHVVLGQKRCGAGAFGQTLWSRHLRQPKSRCEGGGRTCTPIMASMGTSVRGIDTADGGRKIGWSMPKLHSSWIKARHPAWHCTKQPFI